MGKTKSICFLRDRETGQDSVLRVPDFLHFLFITKKKFNDAGFPIGFEVKSRKKEPES